MHPRLRRLLTKTTGAPTLEEWSAFVAAVEAELDRLEAEKAALDGSVRTLTSLLHDAQKAGEDAAGARRERKERSERRARKRERAFAHSPVAIFELSPELVVRHANPAAARLCEAPAPEGQPLLSLLEPRDPQAVALRWSRQLSRLEPVAERLDCDAGDRRGLALDFVCVPSARGSGKPSGVRVFVRDETARVTAHEQRREREEQLSLAIAGGSDVLWDWDVPAGRLHLSSRWREIFGEAATHTPADWLERVHPEDTPLLRAAIAAHLDGRAARLDHEHRVRDVAGEWRWMWVRGSVVRDARGTALRAAGLMSDVTRHRALVDRMAHDARHDALTRLPNRTLFLDLLRHSFRRTRRHANYRFAVLFIDLDDFKAVNDSLGHEAGDELLVQIARRLESCLRHGDTLARHAGDEFTMWLDDVHGDTDALRVAARVHEVMREPFTVAGQTVRSSASIGVAIGSASYPQAEDVLRDADAAMYRAKGMGKAQTAVFERSATAATRARGELEGDLRTALLRNELRLVYMPIVEVASGRLEGLEALARWQHPREGLVAPDRFLALAERTGLITAIDRFMLRAGSQQLRAWRGELAQAARTTLSINVSRKLLEQEGVMAHVDHVLSDARLEPADLTLDLIDGSVETVSAQQLHKRGLRLDMDDFGTAQGWLRHLHSGEIDSVKIDRSFVTATEASGRAVLRQMASIARGLGKRVIAEGVETAEQLDAAREAGCDAAQGFFFSPPLDASEAAALIAQRA